MSDPTVSIIPRRRQPPHDPHTLLVGGRLGWSLAESNLAHTDGALGLPRSPGSLRWLTEPSGSFAGLRTPVNVAVTDSGEIWLLDLGRPRLRRFDPCACGFVDVPCCGGTGSAPGQLRRPSGITIALNHLFVCDTGNQRVQVVLLPHQVVSAIWRAPMEWEPTDVAVDDRFRVHVVDPRNGMVHHFGWSGRYLGNTPGVGASRFIAAGRDGTLFTAGPTQAYRIGPEDDVTQVIAPADDLGPCFPPVPFQVARNGASHLGPLCAPPGDTWFGLSGEPTTAPPSDDQLYEKAGGAVIGPLDSLMEDCTWHAVALTGDLPPGCSVQVDTVTAQVPLSPEEVAALPEQAWETRLVCTALESGAWDGLVRSPAGRYLWIRLRLTGNAAATPRIDELLVEFPRISLRRFLPAVYGAEPTSADFTDRLLAIFDRSLRNVETAVDDLPALLDPYATKHLAWLASWIGLTPDPRLPQSMQRDLIAGARHLLDLRGTVAGLRQLLHLALGFDRRECEPTAGCSACPEPRQTCRPRPVVRPRFVPPPLVLEHFRLRRWFEAGASRLGEQTMLWGHSIVDRSQLGSSAQVGATALKTSQDPLRDPFHVHAHKFTVFVPASAGRTQDRRRALERLVAWAAPAHTAGNVEYVDARFRIGIQASIGLDTVVARMPDGVTLGRTTLGPASVLDGGDRRSIDGSAVGSTTLLG